MFQPSLTRRSMLHQAACGFGLLAAADLLHRSTAQAEPGGSGTFSLDLHHAARAKRVIFLFMHGGPSHVDLFDYKPRLQADDGKELPFAPASRIDAKPTLMASPWSFRRRGQSGLWVSELLPHLAELADELCVIRSLHSRGQSHGQAVSMLHTGSDNLVRPSVGSWVSYGLGSENQDLPAFVSISPPSGHGGPRNYGSAFLPAAHQATTIGSSGKLGEATIRNLSGPAGESSDRRQLDFIQSLNREHLARSGGDGAVEAAIESFEMAFRMQASAPRILELDDEPQYVLDEYGIGQEATDNYGRQCLLARRLAESGVRYVQVSTGNVWDQHGNLQSGLEKNCAATDKPVAGLLRDLKRRGLLEDTLVLWGGEFGRTPIVQGSNGRDHNPQGFTMWACGGGVRGGIAYGQTDEYGYYAQQDRVHMHDLHATLLHLMGIDHERLTYRYAGRDFRLTDVYGRVVRDIIA